MSTRRALLVGLLILACIPLVWWCTCWCIDRRRVDFAERATGLNLSEGVTVRDTMDNGEWFVIVRGAVSDERLQNWLVHGTAREITDVHFPDHQFSAIRFDGAVEEEMLAPRLHPGWYRIQGCVPEKNAWYGVIAPDGDPFWLLVKYPDLGGDGPGCMDDSQFFETTDVRKGGVTRNGAGGLSSSGGDDAP